MNLSDFELWKNYYLDYGKIIRNSDNIRVTSDRRNLDEVIKIVTDVTKGTKVLLYLDIEGDIMKIKNGGI